MVMEMARHPSCEQLDAFARGDIDEDQATTIEDHCSWCEEWQDWLARSSGDDGLIALLRRAGQATVIIENPVAPTLTVEPSPAGYEIVGVLGRGGAGIVYKANQRALGRIVALKQIRSGLDADPHELARF